MANYIVEIKLAEVGTEYTFQEDRNGHKKGDKVLSKGGHAWLILDLNGDGARAVSYTEKPVLFDIDNDGGSLEETGWLPSPYYKNKNKRFRNRQNI